MTDAPHLRHEEVDVGDDLRLHAVLAGQGAPLVLLHGFTGSTESWTPLFDALGAERTIIAVDLPGHGRSSAPADAARYALPRFADDLAALLDALGLARAAVLGYSLGGRAALHFAVRHPARLTALVLESTSPGIADEPERLARRASDDALADDIERGGTEAFVDRWEALPLWESQRALPEATRAALRAQRLWNRPRALASSLRGAGAGSVPALVAELALIDAPTLVVAGALDTRYVAIGRTLAGSIRDARLAIVPDAGHAVHLERPAELARLVLDALRPA